MSDTNSSVGGETFLVSGHRRQHTVAAPVMFRGRGLFHGIEASVRVLPADAGHGIVFRRIDLVDVPDIPALPTYVKPVPRHTAIASCDEAVVETVEHLMAALGGLQIDNALIEINAPEVPSYDGSCRDFCDGILETGVQPLAETVQVWSPAENVSVASPDRRQRVSISRHGRSFAAVTYELDYGPSAPFSPQLFRAELTPAWFYEHVAAARTFVLEDEITALRQMGFGRHLTSRDLVVFGADGVIGNELRWPDEAARHKVLDCVGDLALSGTAFNGEVHAVRSGHHLNQQLAGRLADGATGDSGESSQAA